MFSATSLVLVLALFKVIYERWVTPLSEVPGAFLHSITSIPMRYHMLRGQLPEFIQKLHEKYGPIVRISPQRVSICDISNVKQVLGSHAFVKAPSYDIPGILEPNTFSTRSPELSIERRKQLGPGFSHKHLNSMERNILKHGVVNLQQKIDELFKKTSHDTDAVVVQYHKWFSLIALDTIGALGFGQNFCALQNEHHELIPVLTRIRIFNYITMTLPWLKSLPRLLGRRLKPLAALMTFSAAAIDQRRKDNGHPKADLLQMMLDSGRNDDHREPLNDPQMVSETILHLIAGVDTTSVAMTWTLSLLLHNPHILHRLTMDIRQEFPTRIITFEDCRQRLPYLSAVINESLRILSPAPSILPRIAPTGGVRLGNYLLPAGTWICSSVHSVHMNPAAFSSPTTFNPDRFMCQNQERHNLIAFATGVRACLGRNLALVEMHVVLANLLRNYNLRFPADQNTNSSISSVSKMDSSTTVEFDDKLRGAGMVPDIPRRTWMTMNPIKPERDCLVLVSRPE
ncbi:cytochrome P450 [Coemansia reversa NRRL 1564]|uniref:Cytochrome P450 n=1 Tax=Coemansia reversa (strain ATCC 12441 / NRRL 1564) TaxID=763665 RepID=A0A2G5BCM6_COERN|nr:cytochrome P450 [Coemansia reversa NRRL 1564]|eukprot:PIA16751.1 cytochrome P450 [Coemansia reversa NRRL 1564]